MAPGFTLLEMLVVVVLIGIMATMATLALGNRGNRVTESEANQLAAACNYASDAAVLSGRPRGVVLARDGYVVVQFDGTRWLRDGTGKQRHVPPPLQLESDRLWPSLDEASRTPRPQLLFLPSGEQQVPPVALRNTASAERYLLEISDEGRLHTTAAPP